MKAIRVQVLDKGSFIKEDKVSEWKVDKPLLFRAFFNEAEYEIVIINDIEINNGFKTDFGSIPRLLWIFFDKEAWLSYVLHDYLYKNLGFYYLENGVIKYKKLTRLECDYLLFLGMKDEGASFVENNVVNIGLLIGGWVTWNKCKKIKKLCGIKNEC